MVHMMIKSVTAKFNRCIEFTLADGTVVSCKVQGEKDVAKANAALLMQALAPVPRFGPALDTEAE